MNTAWILVSPSLESPPSDFCSHAPGYKQLLLLHKYFVIMVVFVYVDVAGLMDKGFHGYQGDGKAMESAAAGVIVTDQVEGGYYRVEGETLLFHSLTNIYYANLAVYVQYIC